jgi:sugar/nucleoside kinase (ribokinase family)
VIGEGVDHIFCNKDEAVAFTETDSIEEAFEALKRYTKTFAVTDGGNGAFVFDGESMIKSPGVAADAVDTNGAGDMFAGAFLYAVTAGRDFKWAAELANESAARVVGQFGPRLDSIEFDSIKAKFGI